MPRYGCGKIAKIILQKFSDCNLSGDMIDVFLYLIRLQSAEGYVSAIRYNDVSTTVGMSYTSFYNCINGLEKNGFIQVLNRHKKHGWDIFIVDNDFVTDKDDEKGYVKINKDFIYSEEFYKLRANEKIIALRISSYTTDGYKFYLDLNTELTTRWTGITNKQLIRSYIENLRVFFDIRNEGEFYTAKEKDNAPRDEVTAVNENTTAEQQTFTEQKNVIGQQTAAECVKQTKINKYKYIFKSNGMPATEKALYSPAHYYIKQQLISICLKCKIKYREYDNELNDTVTVVHQYKELGIDIVYQKVKESFETLAGVAPRNVNFLMNQYMNKKFA